MQPHCQLSCIRSIKCHLLKLPKYYVQYFHRLSPCHKGSTYLELFQRFNRKHEQKNIIPRNHWQLAHKSVQYTYLFFLLQFSTFLTLLPTANGIRNSQTGKTGPSVVLLKDIIQTDCKTSKRIYIQFLQTLMYILM